MGEEVVLRVRRWWWEIERGLVGGGGSGGSVEEGGKRFRVGECEGVGWRMESGWCIWGEVSGGWGER